MRGFTPFGGEGNRFAQGEVFEIQTKKDRTRGGLVGGAVGAGIGLILILVDAIADNSSSGDEPAGGWALGAVAWGVIIGAIRGSRTRYRFDR